MGVLVWRRPSAYTYLCGEGGRDRNAFADRPESNPDADRHSDSHTRANNSSYAHGDQHPGSHTGPYNTSHANGHTNSPSHSQRAFYANLNDTGSSDHTGTHSVESWSGSDS